MASVSLRFKSCVRVEDIQSMSLIYRFVIRSAQFKNKVIR
jgi:hypothetical protein